MNDMAYAIMQALGAGGAEWSRQSQLSRQQKLQDEERARRDKLERDALTRQTRLDGDAASDRAFNRSRVADADLRERTKFGVEMDEMGYEERTPGDLTDVGGPDAMSISGLPGAEMLAGALKQTGMQPPPKQWMKTKESARERDLAGQRDRADSIAIAMGLPKGLPMGVLEKLVVDRNNQPRTQYDASRGAIVNMENGTAQAVGGLPQKIVDPMAQATREATAAYKSESLGLRQDAAKDRQVDTLKRQFDGETTIKNSKERADAFNGVLNALKVDNPLGDINVIYSLVKVFDPGSVVKEGEIKLTQKANSLPGQIKLIVENMKTGRMVTAQQKQWVRELIAMQADESQIAPVQKRYGQRVRELGLTPSDSAFIAPSPYENLNIPRKAGNPF